jgi:membrane-anchored glycerophosphoryl diester phosphodiesterase (GDPDase)
MEFSLKYHLSIIRSTIRYLALLFESIFFIFSRRILSSEHNISIFDNLFHRKFHHLRKFNSDQSVLLIFYELFNFKY